MSKKISKNILYCYRFMRLFRVTLFSILDFNLDHISAIVAWAEDCEDGLPEKDDTQKIKWACKEVNIIDDALIIGEYSYDAGWIKSDKISIDKKDILSAFTWEEERVFSAIDELMKIRVIMVDDGEETDSFFLHK